MGGASSALLSEKMACMLKALYFLCFSSLDVVDAVRFKGCVQREVDFGSFFGVLSIDRSNPILSS